VLLIAAATGLEVELRNELVPDASTHRTRALLDELPAASLVFTHREVIDRLFDGRVRCEKGAAWLLDRRADGWIPSRTFRPRRASSARGREVVA